jgi:hypothetical protein
MASKGTAAIELPAVRQEPEPEPAPAVETDALDSTRIGSFAGWGAVRATFHQDVLAHLTYPALERDRVYMVDPTTGCITARIA